ncbi:class I tRNA ligase family protein [Streptomyces sp. NPDC050844]|uniref:class I tRNA ligase family protein n=1 Tax=Streptomyces sp. NPDC050844 TaxID=3155790 RepID=UPI0033D96B4E
MSPSRPVDRITRTPARRTTPRPCPQRAPNARGDGGASAGPTPFRITTAPLEPAGELRVGQLSGPYVAADVLARFLRADGRHVLFTGATADHATAVDARALRRGRSAAEVAAGFRAAVDADWQRAGITFDRVVRARRDRGYGRWLGTLVARLHSEGTLTTRECPLPYCAPCARWLHGAHVTGGCPYCGAAADGTGCHACARPYDAAELARPVCALCSTPAAPRPCRRLFLPLERFRDPLAAYWAALDAPERLAGLFAALLADRLPELPVGQPGEWGVPVPVAGHEDQRVDGRFEAAALELYGRGLEPYGRGPDSGRPASGEALHFGGLRDAVDHAVVLPSLLLACRVPPEVHPRPRFRLSAAHGPGADRTWALDVLNEFGSDAVRRHAVHGEGPARALAVLHGTWNRWLDELFASVRELSGGRVPLETPGGPGWPEHRRRLAHTVRLLRAAYGDGGADTFDPHRAVRLLDATVRMTQALPRAELPQLAGQLSVAAALTAWAHPIMPEGARRLAAALGVPAGGPVTLDALAVPRPGSPVGPPSAPVFGF